MEIIKGKYQDKVEKKAMPYYDSVMFLGIENGYEIYHVSHSSSSYGKYCGLPVWIRVSPKGRVLASEASFKYLGLLKKRTDYYSTLLEQEENGK